jgi:histone H3
MRILLTFEYLFPNKSFCFLQQATRQDWGALRGKVVSLQTESGQLVGWATVQNGPGEAFHNKPLGSKSFTAYTVRLFNHADAVLSAMDIPCDAGGLDDEEGQQPIQTLFDAAAAPNGIYKLTTSLVAGEGDAGPEDDILSSGTLEKCTVLLLEKEGDRGQLEQAVRALFPGPRGAVVASTAVVKQAMAFPDARPRVEQQRTGQLAPRRQLQRAARERDRNQSRPQPTRPRRRFKPGTQALREIRRMQKSVDLLIPKRPFARYVREVTDNNAPEPGFRWTQEGMEALQCAAEDYLTTFFEATQLAAIHGKRVTIQDKDFHFVKGMQDRFGVGAHQLR